MMRHYETIYITNPNLSEEVNKEVIEKFSSLPQKHNGVVVKIEEWGSKRLAYQIKKNDYGFYVVMDYCGGSEITAEIERELKLDDRVLKYQTVKLEDSVDPEALLQKEQEAQAKQAPRETREDKSPEASETKVKKIEESETDVRDTEVSKTESEKNRGERNGRPRYGSE
ncbi:MAG: 30S ribosomal protein S6 [Deltaproteobacteria bacterium]|nr:30S ribosomal protein S6 [Deltaproteobacteria bacterium]